jgi:hypothetical protein
MEEFRSLLEERGLCLGSGVGAMGKKGLFGSVYEGGEKEAEIDPRDYRSSNRKLSMFPSYSGFNFRVERVGTEQRKPRRVKKGSPEEVLWYLRKCMLPVSIVFSSKATSLYQKIDTINFVVGTQNIDLGNSFRQATREGIEEILKSCYEVEEKSFGGGLIVHDYSKDVYVYSNSAWFYDKKDSFKQEGGEGGERSFLKVELVVKVLEYLLNMVEDRLHSSESLLTGSNVGGAICVGNKRKPFQVKMEYNSSFIEMGMDAISGVGDPDILRNEKSVEMVIRRMRSCGDGNIWLRLGFLGRVNKVYGTRVEEVFGDMGVVGYKESSWGKFLFSVEEKFLGDNRYFSSGTNFEIVVEGKVGEYPAGLYLGSGRSLEERYKIQENGRSPCLIEDPVFLDLVDVFRKMERRMSLSRAFCRVEFVMDL